ncbi:Eukaryotic/viral aspartic protease [Phytophthora megakarya]|uniref:Eukaryotic/viral aspartic protease n=1 Tax=Phytophthora megakarya TaxID=4795 RepID=A0A225WKU7_9STRA|nr:Eukaryotic/viral aspartic protease [Phytophthora megakarya]
MLALWIRKALGSWLLVACYVREDHCLFVCRGCGELHNMGKYPMEEFYNQIRQWFNPTKHMDLLPQAAEKILTRMLVGIKLANDKIYTVIHVTRMGNILSQFPVFAKATGMPDLKSPRVWISNQESHEVIRGSRIRIYDLNPRSVMVHRRPRSRGRSRSTDGRQPWIYYGGVTELLSPGKWFRQAKITGKIHNEKAILLLDTGAEVSIVDTAFARKVGCYIDSSQIQDCVGIGDNVCRTDGRTRIKVTLARLLVCFFGVWVGDLTVQQPILGMDFMVPAGIRLDLAHGSIRLPDEIRIQLSGRRQLYSDKAKVINVVQYLQIGAGE